MSQLSQVALHANVPPVKPKPSQVPCKSVPSHHSPGSTTSLPQIAVQLEVSKFEQFDEQTSVPPVKPKSAQVRPARSAPSQISGAWIVSSPHTGPEIQPLVSKVQLAVQASVPPVNP
jgi:hypothetical protein